MLSKPTIHLPLPAQYTHPPPAQHKTSASCPNITQLSLSFLTLSFASSPSRDVRLPPDLSFFRHSSSFGLGPTTPASAPPTLSIIINIGRAGRGRRVFALLRLCRNKATCVHSSASISPCARSLPPFLCHSVSVSSPSHLSLIVANPYTFF